MSAMTRARQRAGSQAAAQRHSGHSGTWRSSVRQRPARRATGDRDAANVAHRAKGEQVHRNEHGITVSMPQLRRFLPHRTLEPQR